MLDLLDRAGLLPLLTEKAKDYKHLLGLPHSYLALAHLETGSPHRIPLWLFGMMY